jgi:hypothetical protein
MIRIIAEPLTHNIKQLGFSGLRGFGSRASFLVGGQERSPKNQPFHIVKRCTQAKQTFCTNDTMIINNIKPNR